MNPDKFYHHIKHFTQQKQTKSQKKDIVSPSNRWCSNPKGLQTGTPYQPFGTPCRVVEKEIFDCFKLIFPTKSHQIISHAKQISINNPRPEDFGEDSPYFSPPFKVTTRREKVVIFCPNHMITSLLILRSDTLPHTHL